MPEIYLAMVISGGGTTMEQILLSCQTGKLAGKVKPVLVIATHLETPGITRAFAYGLHQNQVLILPYQNFESPEAWGYAVLTACHKRGVNLIGQYGSLVKTPENVISEYSGRMINQHPGPIRPGTLDFGGKGMYGRRVHSAVLWFARHVGREFLFTEAISQRVDKEFDQGALLRIEKVPLKKSDTATRLAKRVLKAEYRVQIDTLHDFATSEVSEKKLPEIVLASERNLLKEAKKVAKKRYQRG